MTAAPLRISCRIWWNIPNDLPDFGTPKMWVCSARLVSGNANGSPLASMPMIMRLPAAAGGVGVISLGTGVAVMTRSAGFR